MSFSHTYLIVEEWKVREVFWNTVVMFSVSTGENCGPLKMQVGQNNYIIEETWACFSFLIYKKDTNQSCEELMKP